MIFGHRDNDIARRRVERDIHTGIRQRVDDARLLGFGKRGIERRALGLLRDNKKHQPDERHNNRAHGRQDLAQVLSTGQAIDDGHRTGLRHRGNRGRGFGFRRRSIGIHHCRCFCHFSVLVGLNHQQTRQGSDRHVHDVLIGAKHLVSDVQRQLEAE